MQLFLTSLLVKIPKPHGRCEKTFCVQLISQNGMEWNGMGSDSNFEHILLPEKEKGSIFVHFHGDFRFDVACTKMASREIRTYSYIRLIKSIFCNFQNGVEWTVQLERLSSRRRKINTTFNGFNYLNRASVGRNFVYKITFQTEVSVYHGRHDAFMF